ncbi:MAG TPA: TlpA disulfide reductase family protein [Gemmatimonadaceae bacterium]|nr:TlpA disulfide reductase family protein [Gemmatimonadaceae bacterium]
MTTTTDPSPGAARRRRIFRWLEAAFWVVLVGFAAHRLWPQIAAAVGAPMENAPAPDVSLTALDGSRIAIAELRGQVVLVNFWATWCPPCRVEMPGFQRVYESRRARGFTIVGISTDATAGTVRDFLAERGITYPVAMNAGGVERAFGGASMLPTSILIDRSGRVRHIVRGMFAEPALARAVDRLLDEPASAAAGAARGAATE